MKPKAAFYTLPPDKFEIFTLWADAKIEAYANYYAGDDKLNPDISPRNVDRTERDYWPSLTRYIAAVGSVLHGTKLKTIKLQEILDGMGFIKGHRPTLGTFRFWRSEKRFKKLIEELRAEFASWVAGRILGEFVRPFGKRYSILYDHGGLLLQQDFIREANKYPPDLIIEISAAMARQFSKKAEFEAGGYLGYYMYCILLLGNIINYSAPKNRWRDIYLDVGRKILGCHWQNLRLLDYLTKPPAEPFTKDPAAYGEVKLRMFEDAFADGQFRAIQNSLYREFISIIKTETVRLANTGPGTIGFNSILHSADMDDLMLAIDFLSPTWS